MMNENSVGVWFEDIEGGSIIVYPHCHCGKFVKHGRLLQNVLGGVLLKNWICKVHGEIEPYWTRI